MNETLARHRDQLLARAAEITGKLQTIGEALGERPDPDAEERAAERETDEVLERLGVSGQAELMRIRAALERIEAGTYGICVSCGDTISEERLDLLPDTPFCRNCAR